MVGKKVSSSKGKKSNSKSSVQKKSNGDATSLVEESFNLIQSLNSKLEQVHKSKEDLKDKVSKLSKKVEKHEKVSKSAVKKDDVLGMFKKDILKEVSPILDKFNLSSIKKSLEKDFLENVELEISKLKSELLSKKKVSEKEIAKKISDLEAKVVESLGENKKIRLELKKVKSSSVEVIEEDLRRELDLMIKKQFVRHKNLLLKRFENLSSISEKVDGFGEVINKLERKLSLVKSQFTRFKGEVLLKGDVEAKFVEISKKLEEFSSQVNNFRETEVFKAKKDIEVMLTQNLTLFEDEIKSKFSKIKKDFDLDTTEILKEKEKILSQINRIKQDLESFSNREKENLNKILLDLNKSLLDFESEKKLIEKSLQSKFDEQVKTLGESIKIMKRQSEQSLNLVKKEREAQKDFLVKKYNEIASGIEELEASLQDWVKGELDRQFAEFKSKFDVLNSNINLKLADSIENFTKEKGEYEKGLSDFKSEISLIIKEYVGQLDNELKILKSSSVEFEDRKNEVFEELEKRVLDLIKPSVEKFLEIEKKVLELEQAKKFNSDFLAKKTNEIIDKFNELSKVNQSFLELSKQNLSEEVKKDLDERFKGISEDVAKQILSLKDLSSRLVLESKESQRELFEDVENKFLLSKKQFEEEFYNHLKSFDEELKVKESEFLSKLLVIENDKNLMVEELRNFKSEVAKLTKEYVDKVDSELKLVVAEKKSFEVDSEKFLSEIELLTKARKKELEDYSLVLMENVSKVLEEQREIFNRNENGFRQLFGEKIAVLQEQTHKKLADIEKRFIDKNLRVISEKVAEESKVLELLREDISSKAEELSKKIEIAEAKEEDFISEINAEQEKLKEKVEERLISLEKQFNKRFLDYDTSFNSFKSVVIEEVEALMRDVEKLVGDKVKIFDGNLAKLQFVANDLTNRFNDFKKIEQVVEDQLRDVRDDIADLRVKFEIVEPAVHTINDHVRFMSEYESQLISLIKNLKEKGISDIAINQALINKGHPRFYVSMILENFDEILN